MAGTPIKSMLPNGLCQAHNRRGESCGVRLEVYKKKNGRWLCRFHGGLSTGPRTPEGKAKVALNLVSWRASRKSASSS